MKITNVDLEIQREPFARPFGFKGSCYYEKWNAVVRLEDDKGNHAVGLGGLAPLWSDADVFAAHTETGGNLMMLSMLEHALRRVRGGDWRGPADMFDTVFGDVHDFGKTITGNPGLRPTFTLNALVALDNAAWILHAKRMETTCFDDLVPDDCRSALAHHQQAVAAVPLLTYQLPMETVRRILDDGYFFLKIKIGQPGSEREMVEKDIARVTEIHEIAKTYRTDMTQNGKLLYYLDANGRYKKKASLERLVENLGKIGALEQVALLEEPFDEKASHDVADVPVRVAADESVHSVQDVESRVRQGYRAMAIKPAGKTLTMAFRMIRAASELGAPCYVADNACVPLLVDWNKNVAARLASFPGLKCGVLESNGPTSYPDWAGMLRTHPSRGAPWLTPVDGAFRLDDDFHSRAGGVLGRAEWHEKLFRSNQSR